MKFFDLKNLRKFDCFSPTISLYYNQETKHSSTVSGILSLVQYITFILVSIVYIQIILTHKKPSFSYVKKFLENPGIFYLNRIQFEHFLNFKGSADFDPRAISVIGIPGTSTEGFSLDKIDTDYWVYEMCPNASDKNLLCISSLYNRTKDAFYSVNTSEFYYPSIIYGILNNKSVPYTIMFKRCQNTTQNNNSCYSQEVIDMFIPEIPKTEITFSDHYVDIQKYKEPLVKHKIHLDLGGSQNSIPLTTIYFTPIIVKTNIGFIFDFSTEKKGYSFDRVEKGNYNVQMTDALGILTMKLQNKVDIYERTYLNLVFALANILSITKGTWYIFFFINFFVNKQTICSDFGSLYQKNYLKVIKLNAYSPNKGLQKNLQHPMQAYWNKIQEKSDSSILSFQKPTECSFRKVLLHYMKCKQNYFIKNILNIRTKILDEEKLIKYHIMFTHIDKTSSLFEEKNLRNKNLLKTLTSLKKNFNDKSEYQNSQNDFIKKQNFIKETISENTDD